MKKSRDCYLKILESLVESRRRDKDYKFPMLSAETVSGLTEVFNDYLFSLWMSIGDTAFNEMDYRNSTDSLFEHLKRHTYD